MRIIRTESYEKMSRQAANLISAQVIVKPSCVLGLATGSSPIGTYRQLADWYQKGDVDFSKVKTVNLDEYVGLSPDHPQSYRFFMEEHFFKRVNLSRGNTYLPDGTASDFAEECRRYDERIESLGGIDLQLLGIGHNGHIGFNEPSDHFTGQTFCVQLKESTIEANTRFFESRDQVPRRAITMGMKSIMQARKIVLIASGEDKKEILNRALFGPITPEVPASLLQLHPDLTVVVHNAL